MSQAQRAPSRSSRGSRGRWALLFSRVTPFFVSAVFFLSALFALFSPLPLMAMSLDSGPVRGRRWAWVALLTNAVLAGALGGLWSAIVYLIWVGIPVLIVPPLLARKLKLEWIIATALGAIALASVASVCGWMVAEQGLQGGLTLRPAVLVDGVKSTIQQTLAGVEKILLESTPNQPDAKIAFEQWRESILQEFPSAIAIFTIVMLWLNTSALLKVSRRKLKVVLPVGGLSAWKAPEWWVWPTILAGAGALWAPGHAGVVCVNLLRILLVLYVLQGVAIASVLMRRFRVAPGFRSVLWLLAFLFGIPVVLAVGFFDLWFDFRSRFRHT